MITPGRVGLLVAALAVVALLGSCDSRRRDIDRLTIALPNSAGAALIHTADARGFFAEESLDVTLVATPHGQGAAELLARGEADLAAAAEVVFALSVAKGENLAVLSALSTGGRDNAIVARRDRAVTAPRDLAGKRVGATLGTSGDYFLRAFLVRHRVAPGSIALVDVQPERIPQALTDGTIEAAATWHPFVTRAQQALGSNAIVFIEEDAYRRTFVLFGSAENLRTRRATMQRVLRALIRAEAFILSAPEQALRLAADRMNMAPEGLRATWRDQRFRVDMPQSLLITLQDVIPWAVARGRAPAGRVDFLAHMDLDALREVDRARVTMLR